MGLNRYIVLGSAVVGLLVGLTGAGGGALMTPNGQPRSGQPRPASAVDPPAEPAGDLRAR